MKKALTSSGIIFHGRRSSFLSNDVPLHRHFRLPLPYPFSDTTVYAKSGRNCVKGESRRKAALPLCYSLLPTRSVDGLHLKGFAGGGLPDHGRDDLIISVPVQHLD